MKICFTGAHSTGKTTLLNYLRNNYSLDDSYYITEVARKIINRGFSLGMNATSESYFNFINDQLCEEELAKNKKLVFSDRSIIDTVGYAKANIKTGCSKVKEYVVQALEKIWQLERQYFDLYVYFPIEFQLIDDGFRDLDLDYQKCVDTEIKNLLTNAGINFIELKGTIENRCLKLVEYLTSCGMKI